MTSGLVRATLTRLDTLERVVALWNPESYAISRAHRFAGAESWGGGAPAPQAVVGGGEEFTTDLFLDATREPAGQRDATRLARRLAQWMAVPPAALLPPEVLFGWGAFRFRGHLARLDEVWERFDRDGTPVRGWLRLVLRRS